MSDVMVAATAVSAEVLRRVQAVGLRAAEQHWKHITPELARRAKPQVHRVGDALVTLMKTSDSLRMNRVLGLGHRGLASEETIDAIILLYRAAKIDRFSVQVGPGPQAGVIERWLARRGFECRAGLALLLRDCRIPVPTVPSDLTVERMPRTRAELVVRIIGESFPIPASRRAWSVASAAGPGNQHFVAYAGRIPAAAATLRVDDGLAWLGGAATRTRWRRRGAQSALIAARLTRAARAGCRWAWSETAAPVPGRPAGSNRNLRRLGFEQVCLEPVYVWHA